MSAPSTSFRPQLARLVKSAPDGDRWFHEIKYDGYRIGCRLDRGSVTLYSRNNRDWTATFPEVAEAARSLPAQSAFLDGEVAIMLPDGRTSFQALQNAISGRDRAGLVYFVFDLLFLDGEDFCPRPLEARKQRLRALLDAAPPSLFRYSDHVAGNGHALLEHACRLQLEGIVSKRSDLPYSTGRHDGWVKTKCVNRQEFVIGGFTDPEGIRQGIGALLVGCYDAERRLIFAGKVGTGFTNKSSQEMRKRLEAIAEKATPFAAGLDTWPARHAHWCRPELVAEVTFTEWTGDGKIRHPSFQGLRTDKRPEEIVREQPQNGERWTTGGAWKVGRRGQRQGSVDKPESPEPKAQGRRPAEGRATVAGVAISHPGRIMYPELGLTKLDVARYYEAVAERMLPHLRGRPLTLVRCGEGLVTGRMRDDCIYMKHSKVWAPESLRRVAIRQRTRIGEYVIADSVDALLTLVQMDILEIHTWNSTFEKVEQPDRLVFDIDPGPEVPWVWVIEGARVVRSVLTALGLVSFLKTTGGNGLHVVVPLAPSAGWEHCLSFSREVAAAITRTDPERYTTAFPKAGRERKLLIDYLRNNRTNTSVAAFSTRARPRATVSTPIAWDELTPRLRADRFTVKTVPRRLARLRADPWTKYWTCRQKITARALKAVRSV
jgi:bifunctional non-homologous end joining protein LigD